MDLSVVLAELEALAQKLGIVVAYDHFTGDGMGTGGLCKLKGSWRVIIERRASASEKVSILVKAVNRFDLEAHELSPELRALLERHRARPAEEEAAPAGDSEA